MEDGKHRNGNSIYIQQFPWSIELASVALYYRNDPFAFFGIKESWISSAQAAISERY